MLLSLMRLFLLLFCTTVFSFSSVDLLSQNAIIRFDTDKELTVDQVFDEIIDQTDYTFLYQIGIFDGLPKVKVRKGKIKANKLLEISLPEGYFRFGDGGRNVIVIERVTQEDDRVNEITMQQIIKGKVTDENGAPLSGVNVLLKGSRKGTMTDIDGDFEWTLGVQDEIILVFSYIGMVTKEVLIKDNTQLSIVMKASTEEMDEVVITGIFERRAESFTGSTTVIKREELMKSGNQNLLQNLKNIDPSFRIQDNIDFGSNPNRMPDVQIRGQQGLPDFKGTYQGNPNQPLFILDGFETDISTVFDMDMNRVETVVLLKDAAAKAIYGSRASNGVVVIETHKPKPGQLRVSYKGDLNITVPDLTGYNLTNAQEKYILERDIMTPDYDYHHEYAYYWEQHLNNIRADIARGVDTHWPSKPLQLGVGHRHSAYVEGGDEYVRYGVDLFYNDIKGVMKRSERKTFTGSFSFSYRYKNLMFRNLFSVSLNRGDDSPYGSFSEYTRLNPYWSPYEENGQLKRILGVVGGGGLMETPIGNPMWNAQIGTKNFSEYTGLTNNLYIEWQAMEALKLVGRLGLSRTQNTRDDFYPASHTRFANWDENRFFERGSYDKSLGENSNIRFDLNTHYSHRKGKHQLFVNAGINAQQNSSENVGFSVIGFPTDRLDFIASGREYPLNSRPSGNESISREIGVLSAANYSYDNRYLADFSYRASASSMFGKENRWGHFWSAGAGWNLHNEKFMENFDWLKQFKARASTGYTGSQNFNSYQSLATFGYYQSQAYDNWVGSYLFNLPNDDLRWQKTMDYNVGFDANLWGRLSISFDYYIQKTKDQLLDLTIPPSMGFLTYKENLGSTQNRGVELRINGRLISDPKNDRNLSTFFSIAGNKNKIDKISNALKSFNDTNDDNLTTGSGSAANRPLLRFEEGQSLNAIWAVRSLGIDPASGEELFLTKEGDITTEWRAQDQVVSGESIPSFNGNFGLNADFKGAFINMSFNFQFGGQIYNQTLVDRVENAYLPLNVDKRIYDSVWKKPGDIVAFSYDSNKTTRPSSRFVQDLNELRLSTINIGYDFKHSSLLSILKLKQLKTSFYMNDVFRASSVKIERGLDYPFARTYSISIQATF
ncbi:SusC/RagA family TonB-linked outer membrane protein [Gelidibacter gilvus]|uniref:SusC/RagA family TonB-linked outer membrane protein n=2 Tax=Gelidibacter maritimus TaxID=2761487 RepID=A0A7W2M3I8_9FLAO|nr:SusC/RagA family TonB-linked outer membrane protein [Gelidibacter maritimus]